MLRPGSPLPLEVIPTSPPMGLQQAHLLGPAQVLSSTVVQGASLGIFLDISWEKLLAVAPELSCPESVQWIVSAEKKYL